MTIFVVGHQRIILTGVLPIIKPTIKNSFTIHNRLLNEFLLCIFHMCIVSKFATYIYLSENYRCVQALSTMVCEALLNFTKTVNVNKEK